MTERKERGYHHHHNNNNYHGRKQQHYMKQHAYPGTTTTTSPTAAFATFIDQQPTSTSNQTAAQMIYDPNVDPHSPTTTFAYVYPLSPQFSVQYYTPPPLDQNTNNQNNARYQSYPGSPVLHPFPTSYQLSPTLHPSSPPFSPNLAFHHHHPIHSPPLPPTQAGATSTTTFVLQPSPHHHHHLNGQPFLPPLHISSPILTATQQQQQQVSPNMMTAAFDLMKKRQEQLEQEYHHLTSFHPQNIYVRGLPMTETDESFLELCKVYGPISSSKAIIDQKTGECKGYGFAMFEDQEDCQVAINGLNAAGYQASLARVGQVSWRIGLVLS